MQHNVTLPCDCLEPMMNEKSKKWIRWKEVRTKEDHDLANNVVRVALGEENSIMLDMVGMVVHSRQELLVIDQLSVIIINISDWY